MRNRKGKGRREGAMREGKQEKEKEPNSHFAVHSEIGSSVFKLKDIPKVSDFIVKKLKSFIVRKLVYPKVHK